MSSSKIKNNRSNCFRGMSQTRSAFTLIELLVVISIIALLLSVLMPSLNKARRLAKMVVCKSNQKQIVQAGLLYASSNEGKFPQHISLIKGSSTKYGFPGYLAYYPKNDWSGHLLEKKEQRWLSHYLGDTVGDGSVFHCPLSPPRDLEKMKELYLDPTIASKSTSGSYGMFWGGWNAGGLVVGEGKYVAPKNLQEVSSKTFITMDMVFNNSLNDPQQIFTTHKTGGGSGSKTNQFGTWTVNGNADTIGDVIGNTQYNVGYGDGHVGVMRGSDLTSVSYNHAVQYYLPADSLSWPTGRRD